MLIISSSTSSSLLFQWDCEGWNGILWKGNGPDIELEASPSVSESELMHSMSELSFEVEGRFEGTIGRHFLRIWLGTGSRVTEIKVASLDTGHQTKEWEELTKVKNPVLYTYFTLWKLTGSHDVKASWERPVIWIDDERLSGIWRLHTNEPRGSKCIVWFRFTHPIEKIREEIAELLVNDWVGVGGKEFKSRVLHNTKARLLHTSERHRRYINIWLKAIHRVERWRVRQVHIAILDCWRLSDDDKSNNMQFIPLWYQQWERWSCPW